MLECHLSTVEPSSIVPPIPREQRDARTWIDPEVLERMVRSRLEVV